MDVRLEADRYLVQFASYEDYLDSLITPVDLSYIGSVERARALAELGARNIAETLTAEEFKWKRAAVVKSLSRKPHVLCSAGLQLDDPLLAELAAREKPNRTGHLCTIVFLRCATRSRGEVSAYIDYGDRLERDDWRPVFQGRSRIEQRDTDLSFRSWRTGDIYFNDSRNFTNEMHPVHGLAFKNRHDSETVVVDPALPSPGSNSQLVSVRTRSYAQVLLYDHVVRRR